jgi:hypothetical protein
LNTTTHGLRTAVSKKPSRKNPIKARGDGRGQDKVRQPLVRVGEVPLARRERARERPGHPEQIPPEKRDHGDERSEVQRHVEGETETVLVQPKEILPEQEVSGAGYRQELGQPLHHAEQYRL